MQHNYVNMQLIYVNMHLRYGVTQQSVNLRLLVDRKGINNLSIILPVHMPFVYIVANSKVAILRWYGTPCNIYKDERILKYDYNNSFKTFKSITFAQKLLL